MDKPALTLLFGLNKTGKTSIQNHLIEKFGYNGVDAGNPLKIVYANQFVLGQAFLDNGTEGLLDYLQVHQHALLNRYEVMRDKWDRAAVIGLAEAMRVAYPDVWVKLAKQIGYLSPDWPCVAALLNPTELKVYEQHYTVENIINLECERVSNETADTRYLGDIPHTHTFVYALDDSPNITKYIADYIATNLLQYNQGKIFKVNPNGTMDISNYLY